MAAPAESGAKDPSLPTRLDQGDPGHKLNGMKKLVLIALIILGCTMGQETPAANGRPALRCDQMPCRYSVSGGSFLLESAGFSFRCLGVVGAGRFQSSTIGWISLGFSNCHEQSTPFHFSCLGLEQPFTTVRTNEMGTSPLEEEGIQGYLLSGVVVRMRCGASPQLTLEGFFDAGISKEECNRDTDRFSVHMKLIGHGRQGSGPNYDLFIDGYEGEDYDFTSPWYFRFAHPVVIDC